MYIPTEFAKICSIMPERAARMATEKERVLGALRSLNGSSYPLSTTRIAAEMAGGKPTRKDRITVFLAMGILEDEGIVKSRVVKPGYIAFELVNLTKAK